MSLADELSRLQRLRDEGALTEVEFEQAKRKAIEQHSPPPGSPFGGFAGAKVPGQVYGVDEKIWCALMHLSQLLIASVLGIAVPIVAAIKATKRETWSYPLAIRFFPED